MENKYKRLLKSGGIHGSKHFENVLITAKRFPILTGYGPAINMRSGSINNSIATPRSSFFRRGYSTSTVLCARREAVDLRRIYKISQHVPISLTSLSDYKALTLKQRLVNHVYSKAKTYKLGNSSEIDSITLDPRFIRLKSPRSGRFIQRLPLKYKANLNNSINAHLQETNAAALFVRRSVRMGTSRLEEGQQLAMARVENKVRKNLNALNFRSRAAQVTAFKPRRLYTDKSRAQRYAKSLQLQ